MSDPVEIAAEGLRDCGGLWSPEHNKAERVQLANIALIALCDAGWRIVRTESVEAVVDGNGEWLTLITEEWTP